MIFCKKSLLRQFGLLLVLCLLAGCASAPEGSGETAVSLLPTSTLPPALQLPTATPAPITTLPTNTPLAAYPAETAYPSESAFTVEIQPAATVPSVDSNTPTYTYRILNTYPHDPAAFTQGLIYTPGDILYEGTGLRGQSTLRRVNLLTGEVQQRHALANELFGEGITLFNNKIYQLTWQARVGFVYDANTFEPLQQFNYPTEGWGITHDGTRLIMSDGTAIIRFWDPETLAEIGQIEVFDGDPATGSAQAVTRLNELEYINGEIYANVWQTDRIARIDPENGRVLGWIDLTGLLTSEERQQADVLNGIAYDPDGDRLFVTGKLWPKIFEIELLPTNP